MYLQFKLTRIQTLISLCLLLLTTGIVAAQNPQVDAEFNPFVTRESNFVATSGTAGSMLIQPDGKIVLSAFYRQSDGTRQDYLFRVNADGSLDNTFNCQICGEISFTEPVLSPDGKILIYAPFRLSDTAWRARLIWLNLDGSVNRVQLPELNEGPIGGFTYSNRIVAVQPDGKVLIGQNVVSPFITSSSVTRLNADGTRDAAFQSLSGGISDIAFLPDGKFFATGPSNTLARYNQDGTRDTSFESPSVACSNSNCGFGLPPAVFAFGIQSSGKIVIGGRFTSVNGINRSGLARLQPAGNVDLDFTPPDFGVISQVEITPDDKIIIGDGSLLRRLNADGTPDNTFNPPAFTYRNWKLDSLGRIIFFAGVAADTYRFGRLNPDGTLDTFFSFPAVKGSISALARQTDGKLIAAGNFDKINGTARNRIARVSADGSVDASFDAGTGFDVAPDVLVVQPDGKILAGGSFTSFNGATRVNIIRLNANGTLDNTFNPVVEGSVYAIAAQPDGKILVGGTFTQVNGATRNRLARLNADGSLDNGFNPILSGSEVRAIIVEADGKIDIGGDFGGINGFSRGNAARLFADGNVDTTFNAVDVFNSVRKIIRQPDGKYLYMSSTIYRRNNDGSVDNTFRTPAFNSDRRLNDLTLQPDGTIIVGGLFFTVNDIGQNNIARLLPNGALDRLYLFSGANAEVKALLTQPDGKTVVGGLFTIIGDTSRSGLARINNVPVVNRFPAFDFNGDGKADLAVFRPSTGSWYIARLTGVPSQNFDAVQFGTNGDVIVPADYDGDGKTDVAVWRPSDGVWYIMQSTAGFRAAQFGTNGDIPVPGDFDGDGKANLAVFRPSTGSWYIARATGVPNQNFDSVQFGANGDKPIAGADFDGDGKADVTVFRPTDGTWYRINSSTNQFVGFQFGISEDMPVAADYDGDGRTDIAVWRPSNGTWYRINSSNNIFSGVQFGAAGDRPAPADYNGDGRADFVVFRPTDGNWYLLYSNNAFNAFQFGSNGDLPAANAFVR